MRKNNQIQNRGEIIIYQTSKKEVELKVYFKNESVWLRQNEIAVLFEKERSVITKHINKIFIDREIDKKSNVQKMHIPNSDKPVEFYSLDMILAVGYRVNSSRAIHFRIWATKILKQYLIQGYAVNEKRLLEAKEKFEELRNTIVFLQEKSKKELLTGQSQEILNLLSSYTKTLTLLNKYDTGELQDIKGKTTKFVLEYENCWKIIVKLKKELIAKKEASDFFGAQKDKSFEGIIKGLNQIFENKKLYATIEDKAAHLLYFAIKDHAFTDGNKRIASFLFVYFLDKNNYLYKKSGERKINDNALIALALLIAESAPKEKDVMIKIIKNLLKE